MIDILFSCKNKFNDTRSIGKVGIIMSEWFEKVSDFTSGLSTVIEMDNLKPTLETTKAVRHFVKEFIEYEEDGLEVGYPGLMLRCKHLIEKSDKAISFYLDEKERRRSTGVSIEIKYFDHGDKPIRIGQANRSDWVDLYVAEDVVIPGKKQAFIPLGVGMILPRNYEAIIAPRSSTFKNYGIVQTNSIGVIDNSYSGDEDEWKMPVYNVHDVNVTIPRGARICQFRLVKNQPKITFKDVDRLHQISRGGFGSTGK